MSIFSKISFNIRDYFWTFQNVHESFFTKVWNRLSNIRKTGNFGKRVSVEYPQNRCQSPVNTSICKWRAFYGNPVSLLYSANWNFLQNQSNLQIYFQQRTCNVFAPTQTHTHSSQVNIRIYVCSGQTMARLYFPTMLDLQVLLRGLLGRKVSAFTCGFGEVTSILRNTRAQT